MKCPHEDNILYGKSIRINKLNRCVQVTCDTCNAFGTVYEQREKHSGNSDWYEVREVWHELTDYYGEITAKVVRQSERPYKFIHDITKKYHKFHNQHWFYPADGYSDNFIKRNCYSFDGQVFFKNTS